jgi:hypothetical protein
VAAGPCSLHKCGDMLVLLPGAKRHQRQHDMLFLSLSPFLHVCLTLSQFLPGPLSLPLSVFIVMPLSIPPSQSLPLNPSLTVSLPIASLPTVTPPPHALSMDSRLHYMRYCRGPASIRTELRLYKRAPCISQHFIRRTTVLQ